MGLAQLACAGRDFVLKFCGRDPAGRPARGRASRRAAARGETPISLTRAEAEHARFCFLGEFGYELVAWIPYLLHLKKALGLRLHTVGRPGSRVFYEFSHRHDEVDSSFIGDVWGFPDSYQRLRALHPGAPLVHPGRHPINRRAIVIDGIHWTTRNIHARIDQTNYVLPDFSRIAPYNPLPGRPLVVINNKYFVQWPDTYSEPLNYFDRASLVRLRDLLVSRGYGVVYNHFVERTIHDEHLTLDDAGIFGLDDRTHDLRLDYARAHDAAARNRLQLALYNAAEFVLGPQGGNLYLPAVCRKPLFILMRAGDYIDYVELGRLYGIPVELFYEPRHLLAWLEQASPATRNPPTPRAESRPAGAPGAAPARRPVEFGAPLS